MRNLPQGRFTTRLYKSVPRNYWPDLDKVVLELGLLRPYGERSRKKVDLSSPLEGAFRWSISPQGVLFWNKVLSGMILKREKGPDA